MALNPLQVVTISADADYHFYKMLVIHLEVIQRMGRITLWHDSQILPGGDIIQERKRHLDTAALILLLLSADFLTSEACMEQLAYALQRRAADSVPVLPIILRPVDITQLPLANIKALPRGGRPVTQWSDSDAAYIDIVQGIHELVRALASR